MKPNDLLRDLNDPTWREKEQARYAKLIDAVPTVKQSLQVENDRLRKELAELRLQVISDIGQEIDAEPAPCLTKGQAKAILDLALDLEKTGRLVSLTEGQERSDFVARNRSIQCALEDVLRNLTEPEPTRASLRHDQSEPKAEPVQEPHAWLHNEHQGWVVRMPPPDTGEGRWYPVYTAPDGLRKAAQMALSVLHPDTDEYKALRKKLGQ
jgi:hypothetical protein